MNTALCISFLMKASPKKMINIYRLCFISEPTLLNTSNWVKLYLHLKILTFEENRIHIEDTRLTLMIDFMLLGNFKANLLC